MLTKPLLHLVLGSMQNVLRYTTVHQIKAVLILVRQIAKKLKTVG